MAARNYRTCLFAIPALLLGCTPAQQAQLSQFAGNVGPSASSWDDYTWTYKSQTFHLTSMKTTSAEVINEAGPPLKDETNLLGERVMTYRTSGGGDTLGDCGGADYCAQRYLVNPRQILDMVLTFNRDGLLIKMDNIDKSNDPEAIQWAAAHQGDAGPAQTQPDPQPSPQPQELSPTEHMDLQNLILLDDYRQYCHWSLPHKTASAFARKLKNYESRINSFDLDVMKSHIDYLANTKRIDACTDPAYRAQFDKNLRYLLSDH